MPKFRPGGARKFRGVRPSAVAVAAAAVTACITAISACAVGPTGAVDVDDRPRFADTGDRVVVATTFTVLADMVRRVGGDRVQVESVTTPGADVHQYEPSVEDLKRVEGADLVVSNGL